VKLVVVSLARALERRALISAQLNTIGAPYCFLDATDGRELTRFERSFVDDRGRRAITKYPLTDGEIGCWHSHRRIMVDLAMNGPEMVAVVEDDVAILPDFLRVLAAVEQSRVAFDVLDIHRVFKPSQTFVRHSTLCDGFDIGWLRYTQMTTTGYVIRREGAIKFLQSVPRFAHAVDKALKRWWANGLNYFVLSKPIVSVPRHGHSHIDDDGRASRVAYDDADRLYWRAVRGITRASDSLSKRRQFEVMIRRSQALLPEVDEAIAERHLQLRAAQ
jgi:glycosyl transferase family 25